MGIYTYNMATRVAVIAVVIAAAVAVGLVSEV